MEDVGVKAVVENTKSFLGDMRKMNLSVDGFVDEILNLGVKLADTTGSEMFTDSILGAAGAVSNFHPAVKIAIEAIVLLGKDIKRLAGDIKTVFVKAFELAKVALKAFGKVIKFVFSPAKSIVDAFVSSLRRIGEIATGILIANTVRKLADTISGMATSALDAAINFQTLEVRLKGLAARQIFNDEGVQDFGMALDMATGKAADLLDWVIDLSLKAPISTEAIANTLTLATSYGLAEDAAKDMTKAVLVFASGMGLTDLAQRRIIENYGQMIQQGKITSMEMRDMARGAFVPVGDLLQRTADLLGMTADEFDGTAGSVNKFAEEKGLDSVMTFMQAFIDMTETEFSGAIERMGATIQGLRQRFKNLTGAIIGLNILKPSLDLLGASISKIFDKIAESEKIQIISKEIGEGLKEMVEDLLGEMPSVEVIVSKIETALENVRDALGMFREGDLAGGLATLGVPQSLIDFIGLIQGFTASEEMTSFLDNINKAFNNLKTFWDTNKETIMEALRVAAGEIFDAIGIEMPEDAGGGILAWTENLDVEAVIQKITDVKNGILGFIAAIQNIPVIWEENKWVFVAIGAAFFALRYPLLTLMGLFFGFPAIVGNAARKATEKIMETDWFQTGADAMAEFLNGLIDGFAKLWAWAVEKARALAALFSPYTGGGGGGGGTTTNSMEGMQTTISTPTSHNTTNYNFDVAASYGRTQSPATLRDDVAVLMSKLL